VREEVIDAELREKELRDASEVDLEYAHILFDLEVVERFHLKVPLACIAER